MKTVNCDRCDAALISAGMSAIDDRANALILRDKVKHLEDALLAAGNLARALQRRVDDLTKGTAK